MQKPVEHTCGLQERSKNFRNEMNFIKRTVSVISSDRSCKDENARFTTEPLKTLYDQQYGRYRRLSRFERV